MYCYDPYQVKSNGSNKWEWINPSENEGCNIALQGYLPAGSIVACTSFFRGPFGEVNIMPGISYFPDDYEVDASSPLTILKNSSFFISGITGDYVAEGSIVAGETTQDGYYSFWVTGDCKITF